MNTTSVNGALFAAMIKNGAASLKNKVKEVNDLNVFPIPDGDTGDNMFLTIDAGVVALAAETPSVGEASRLAANAAGASVLAPQAARDITMTRASSIAISFFILFTS